MNTLSLFLCRPGFEKDLAAELSYWYAKKSVPGYCKASNHQGFVEFHSEQPMGIALHNLIFARQIIANAQLVENLPETDRISPLLHALEELLPQKFYQDFLLEYPDTNDGKSLSRFVKKFQHPLARQLKAHGFKKEPHSSRPFIHICFISYEKAYIGLSFADSRSQFCGGIRHLRADTQAPSRSSLKLEEAILELMPPNYHKHLTPNATAVDLGAAPGGWTYQLMKRGLFTYAVDNGPMNPALLATNLVEHCREDGYKFHPRGQVDILVCDMVDKPSLVVTLVKKWLSNRWCHCCIFNLKLPMKKRFQEVQQCLKELNDISNVHIQAKHLYHDREEITVFAGLVP